MACCDCLTFITSCSATVAARILALALLPCLLPAAAAGQDGGIFTPAGPVLH